MLDVITKIFCALLCGYTFFYIYKKIMNTEISILKEVIVVVLLAIITYVSYVVKYNTEITILKFIVFIIVFKIFYKDSIYRITITNLLSIFVVLIGDVLVSTFMNIFISVNQLRGVWYIILISNTLVCVLSVILINIPFIITKIKKLISKVSGKDKVSYITILALAIIIAFYTIYNISLNYNWSEKYFINLLITISYIIIVVVFFVDKFKYNSLEEKYDALFEYFSEISENIDDLNLTTHEYKNQIAIVSNYIDDKKYKKAKTYLDDISKSISKDEGLLVNLTDIPMGGLKGLLYYKIVVAKNQQVEVVLDVGKSIKTLFSLLSQDQIKIITKIIGVYIDNAISASKNKIVNIEIYSIDDKLSFTISNKVDKNINIDKIGKKGFTTKGKGHGQGLYIVNKLINRNKWLESEKRIVNDYYVTKLIVDTKNIGK